MSALSSSTMTMIITISIYFASESIFLTAFSTKSYNNNRNHRYLSSYDDNDSFSPVSPSSYSSSLLSKQGRQQHQQQRTRHNTMTLHLSSAITEIPIMSDLVSTYGYCLKNHFFPTQSMTNAVLTMVGDGFAQSKENSDNMKEEQQQQQSSSTATYSNEDDNVIQYNYDPKRGMIYFFKGLGSGILWAWWFEQADVLSRELTQSTLSHIHGFFDTTTTTLSSSRVQQQEIVDFTTTMTTTTTVVAAAAAIATTTTTLLAQQTEKIVQTTINILMEQFLVCPILFTLWDIPVTAMMQGDTKASQIPDQIDSKLIPLLIANAKVYTFANIITYNVPLQYRLLSASAFSIISETINSGITSSTQVPQTSQIIVNNSNSKNQERITPVTVLVPMKSYSKVKVPMMTNSTY